MLVEFILGVIVTLLVQYVYETYVKSPTETLAPVEEVVVPADKKVRKPRAKKTKKG